MNSYMVFGIKLSENDLMEYATRMDPMFRFKYINAVINHIQHNKRYYREISLVNKWEWKPPMPELLAIIPDTILVPHSYSPDDEEYILLVPEVDSPGYRIAIEYAKPGFYEVADECGCCT